MDGDIPSAASAAAASLYQATVEAGAPAAGRIARALDEAADPEALAVSYFDLGGGRFEVSGHYAGLPAHDALMDLIHAAAEGEDVGPLRIEPVAAEDWVILSQGKRTLVHAGRFLIYGSHDRDTVPHRRLAIEIDAARAFGTAHHATTRGCLLALDDALKRRRPRAVLDLGTGTGILAIAAAKALGRSVLATDNDPVAVAIAADNARKAGVGSQVRAFEADGLANPQLTCRKPDLILANLLARPLYRLAPAMARSLAFGGIAILSGLTAEQARPIEARYLAHGCTKEKRIILDGWATLVLKRRSARVLCD
jgi:ribosomal protein L11 methyltransferase